MRYGGVEAVGKSSRRGSKGRSVILGVWDQVCICLFRFVLPGGAVVVGMGSQRIVGAEVLKRRGNRGLNAMGGYGARKVSGRSDGWKGPA